MTTYGNVSNVSAKVNSKTLDELQFSGSVGPVVRGTISISKGEIFKISGGQALSATFYPLKGVN